jgi:hypothetical protein
VLLYLIAYSILFLVFLVFLLKEKDVKAGILKMERQYCMKAQFYSSVGKYFSLKRKSSNRSFKEEASVCKHVFCAEGKFAARGDEKSVRNRTLKKWVWNIKKRFLHGMN